MTKIVVMPLVISNVMATPPQTSNKGCTIREGNIAAQGAPPGWGGRQNIHGTNPRGPCPMTQRCTHHLLHPPCGRRGDPDCHVCSLSPLWDTWQESIIQLHHLLSLIMEEVTFGMSESNTITGFIANAFTVQLQNNIILRHLKPFIFFSSYKLRKEDLDVFHFSKFFQKSLPIVGFSDAEYACPAPRHHDVIESGNLQ